MRYIFFILALFCCGVVQAQDGVVATQVLKLPNFGGLNTVDVHPEPGEAVIAHEVDLSRGRVGTFAKRRGFDKVDSLTVVSEIVKLEALQFNDGTKYLMVIGKDVDSGWGKVYVSNEGSENFEDDSLTLVYSHLPITGDLAVSKLRDKYYITTSVGRGIVLHKDANGFRTRPFPVLAPGEPLIVPFDTIPGASNARRLNGTYRYAFVLMRTRAGGSYTDLSVISTPIKIRYNILLLNQHLMDYELTPIFQILEEIHLYSFFVLQKREQYLHTCEYQTE